MPTTIVLLPGDGIGPEVMGPAVEVLNAVAPDLRYEEQLFGGASVDAQRIPAPPNRGVVREWGDARPDDRTGAGGAR